MPRWMDNCPECNGTGTQRTTMHRPEGDREGHAQCTGCQGRGLTELTQPPDGGPAFPRARNIWPDPDSPAAGDESEAQEGMSLRDWLAGQALNRILAERNPASNPASIDPASIDRDSDLSYQYADSMLRARKR